MKPLSKKDQLKLRALEAGFMDFEADAYARCLARFEHSVRMDEREACAKVVENHALGYAEPVWALKLIDTIRERETK